MEKPEDLLRDFGKGITAFDDALKQRKGLREKLEASLKALVELFEREGELKMRSNLLIALEFMLDFLLRFEDDSDEGYEFEPVGDFPRMVLSRPSLEGIEDIKSLILELLEKSDEYMSDTQLKREFQGELQEFMRFWQRCSDTKRCILKFLTDYLNVSKKTDLVKILQRASGEEIDLASIGSEVDLAHLSNFEELDNLYYSIGLLIVSYVFVKYPLRAAFKDRVTLQVEEYFEEHGEGFSNNEDIIQQLYKLKEWFFRNEVAFDLKEMRNRKGLPRVLKSTSTPGDAESLEEGGCGFASFLAWTFLRAKGIKEDDIKFVFVKGDKEKGEENHVFVIANIDNQLYKVDLAKSIIQPLNSLNSEEVGLEVDPGWGYLFTLLHNTHLEEIRGGKSDKLSTDLLRALKEVALRLGRIGVVNLKN